MPESRRSIRTLIVDDEPLARDCVRLALRRDADFEVVAECGDGLSAESAIRRHDPDLVFLDVQMPGLDGFEVIETIGPERMPPVVFVTAYDAHALRAFRLHAMDYLLKPFDDERFAETLLHARRQLGPARGGSGPGASPICSPARPSPPGSWRAGTIGSSSFQSRPWTGSKPPATTCGSMRGHAPSWCGSRLSALLEQLDPSVFARIHRSAIVNVSRVREMHPWYGGDYTAVLTDGQELRVSRYYREALLRTVS